MWGWVSLVACLSGPLMGLGRPGLALAERWAAGRVSWVCCSRVWLACPCWYRRHTLCCLCLVVVGASVRACVRVGVACCRGSGAVRPGLPGPSRVPFLGVLGGCGWVGCELYSGREHLTVRFLRQMFLFCSCVFVVCFFERSVDALASGADEGRGGLRYSSGSRLAGCDPRVSEWGDPARVMSCHLHLNCIGCGG